MRNNYLKLMLITKRNNQEFSQYLNFLKLCLDSGITSLQIREKNIAKGSLLNYLEQIKKIIQPYNIPLIINDDVELAKIIDADGVHLGQSDLSPQIARETLGKNKIIGLSIESKLQLQQANQLDYINYIAASSVFATNTKSDIKTIWHLDGLLCLVKNSKHPVVAIGGIDQLNIHSVMATGCSGAAVISAIHDAPNPRDYINKLLGTLPTLG